MKKLFVLLSTFAAVSFAGITSVGNGGGFAELQYVYFFENSADYLSICTTADNICGLTQSESDKLHELKNYSAVSSSGYIIGFKPTLDNYYSVNGKEITFSSKDLYQDNGQFRPAYEILSLALATLSTLKKNSTDFHSEYDFYKNVYAKLHFNIRSREALYKKYQILFHELTLATASKNKLWLSLEDSKKSVDLNKIILQQYPETNIDVLNIQQSDMLSMEDGVYIYNQLDNATYSRMVIKIPINAQGLIIEDAIKVKLLN